MKFKDVFLINERKVEVDGKVFNSEKEAGIYLGSIGKNWQEIMKIVGTNERMAKYYEGQGKKKGPLVKPEKKVPKPIPQPVVPTPKPIDDDKKKEREKKWEALAKAREVKPIPTNTALPIVFNSNINFDSLKVKDTDDAITSTFLEKELSTKKTGEISSVVKDNTYAVAMIEGKLIYTPNDLPIVPTSNVKIEEAVQKIVQNNGALVTDALKDLPQEMIDLLAKSKTFKNRRTFVKTSLKKTGGHCSSSDYSIYAGLGHKNMEKNLNTVRHEMMHMWEGSQYNITYKLGDKILNADISRMKTPSTKITAMVEETLSRIDFGLYRTEAEKILHHYDLTFEDLAKFITYDTQDRLELKARGAFMFALYLSQGDLTNAMKSLYQNQALNLDGKYVWLNSIHNNECVMGSISDFIGSMTKNKVMGRGNNLSGHTNAYYKKRSMTRAKNCELIADYGVIVGCKAGVEAKKILKAFAPHTVNAIDTILRTQTYLNYKGEDDVNYI